MARLTDRETNTDRKVFGSPSRKRRLFQSTLAFGLIAGLIGACGEGAQLGGTPGDDSAVVEAEDVAENTEAYIGQTVTIRSEPIDQVDNYSFTVSDQRFFGNDPILVINASGEPLLLPEGNAPVQVTGEVRNFVRADVEREFNFALDPNLYQDYENQPTIIAQSIALAPEPGEISDNPERYYGQTLAVTGEVDELQTESAFTLEEGRLLGGENLLVLYVSPREGSDQPQARTPLPALQENEEVAVTGVLRPFIVAEFERDYDLGWDLQFRERIEAEYTNRPVLVATDIYPSLIPE
ncbi:hypothetical protein [Leptolyngbya sp. KIOST-1]|uniref:hypothetical protein n=1 Tax=Leptolyngbya sp. KIOST-1 TaxID=1229172 RepID=UPI00069053B0|nr:hypothetical protein [Leptolyngbya sp. KIOST-1]